MRSEYLEWDDYFMAVGFLSAKRSKDPSSQVGACIVNGKKIIASIGYNGMPKGCSDDELPWNKEAEHESDTKYMYVVHAEVNAVLNKNSADLAGCVIYVALFPCIDCAKIIIQSEIKEVVYFSDKHGHKPSTIASRQLLNDCGVIIRQYIPKLPKLVISMKLLTDELNNEINRSTTNERLLPNKHPVWDINKKRNDYISWEDYFIALAFLSAQRSKEPSAQVGSCIVNSDNKIVGIGYNGKPRGCDNEASLNITSDSGTKFSYVCHAVMNAILNKNCSEVKGCRIYVSSFPCNECAKFIIQVEIKEIIYFSLDDDWTPQVKAAKRMFDLVGIKYRKYSGSLENICIDFSV